MEGTSRWPPPPGDPADLSAASSSDATSGDWRSQLQPEARERVVGKIMENLLKHFPTSTRDGLNQLNNLAVQFEDKIFTAAINQPDYLRRISLKMLSMEAITQGTATVNPSFSNPTVGNQSFADSGSTLGMQPQVSNQRQSLVLPLVNQSQVQQPLPHNLQCSAGLPSELSSVIGLGQPAIDNVSQTSNMQNRSGVSQNSINNSAGQCVTQNIYTNTQRQNHGRQQHSPIISQQQQQSQNHLIYQKQFEQILMKHKLQHPSLMQPHMQNQQSFLQTNQLQSSHQPLMQMAPSLQSGQSIQTTQPAMLPSVTQPSLQQNEQHAIQQSIPLLQQHPRSIAKQQQGQPTMHQQPNSLQQQLTPILQQSLLPSQQQEQKLIGQQSNMRRTQLLVQQDNVLDMQQKHQQRLSSQQNTFMSMQQPQQMLSQQTISLHQKQQFGSQSNFSGLQQQQLLGPQTSAPSMQHHQPSMHILQQSKSVAPQQSQQPSLTLFQSQGQQSHHQSSQQQLMPQIQTQPPQMQQQPLALQRDIQQRVQDSGTMLQNKNTIEQQNQFIQSQRGLQEASSSSSMDSTAQTGLAGAVDWQEDLYQKVKSMKESYLPGLREFHRKIVLKFQQMESTPLANQSGQFGKLKEYKSCLEQLMGILQISKNNIRPDLKEKLPSIEKQIKSALTSHRSKKIAPSQLKPQQQFQHHSGHAHSILQQQPSQVPQLQKHDNHVNQFQQVQCSVPSMQTAPASSMQHGSVPLSTHVPVSTSQPIMANALQSPKLDPIQGSSFSSLQQGTMASVQQGSNVLQHHNLKQQRQEQHHQLLQTQSMKQQMQEHQMQQQQLLKQTLMPPQYHQQKQQQIPVHQFSQLHQMNDVRQGSGSKPGIYQQHFPGGQHHNYYQQLKNSASFPISSPHNLLASSPQVSQHSSPQIDQQSMLSSHTKDGTPSQSANSSCFAPSPSTPITPSPGDSEKLSGISSLTNAVNFGHQQTAISPARPQALAVGTPGISASPLLAEYTTPDGSQANASTSFPGKSSITERPLDLLVKLVQSLPYKALSSSVADIGAVVSMTDRMAGSAPGNGSRAALGEDLGAITKCRLQAQNFISQYRNPTTMNMKHLPSAMPLNIMSSKGSVNDNFKQLCGPDTSDLESTATSNVKRQKVEANHALLEEIKEINQQLVDTVVSLSDGDVDSISTSTGGVDGAVVIFSFIAVSLCSNLKSQFSSAQASPIMPLRLLVPTDYPKSSPLLVDKLPVEASVESEVISIKVQSIFNISLRRLSQPMSLGEMAKTWDLSVRKVITEYAQQSGGGSFSSRYGPWENC